MAQWALSTFKYLRISQCSQVALIAFIQIMRYFTHVGYVQNKKKCSHGSLLCLQFPLSQTTAELKNVSQFWTAYYVLLLSKDDQDIYISGGRTELQYRLKHMIFYSSKLWIVHIFKWLQVQLDLFWFKDLKIRVCVDLFTNCRMRINVSLLYLWLFISNQPAKGSTSLNLLDLPPLFKI